MSAKSTFGSATVIPYSSSSSSYKISRSLRFNSADSAYLNRTFSGTPTTYTMSFWVKRAKLSGGTEQVIFGCRQGASFPATFSFGSGDNITFYTGPTVLAISTTALFRDTSAWYHIVTSVTPSATSYLYVNGIQIGSWTASSNPYLFNSAYTNTIGRYGDSSSQYFDGYLSEVNFIDGQALTPSSFGYTDPTTGVWTPKKYVGTYGTNGFYLPFTNQSTTQNLFTYSEDFSNVFWSKYLCTCTTDATTAPNGTNTADKMVINNGQPYGQFYTSYSATDNTTYTSSVYVKALDFTTGVLYIQKKDGVFSYVNFDLTAGTITAEVAGATGTITSVGNGWYRVTCTVNVGTGASSTPTIHFQFTGTGDGVKSSYIWGAQFEISSSAGPYMYTLASVQAQTLALGEDRSLPTGGYNNWVSNNFSVTTGSGNDSLLDSPTDYGTDTGLGGEVRGNYATFNPVDLGGSTLTNGNLDISSTANQYRYATMPVPQTGKWYFEFTVNSLGATNTGFWIVLPTLGGVFGLPVSGAYRILKDASDISITGSGTPAAGHTMKVAYDADNKRIWFGRDTLWFSNAGNTTSDPSAGTNPSFSNLTTSNYDSIYVLQTGGGVATCTGSINFGQRPFAYAAPTGFKTLCTANLPAPPIKKPSIGFDAITYNGRGTTFVSPSGLNFAPDLIWVKSRSQDISHVLSDTVRGVGEVVCTNNTRAASPDSFITNFNQNGFTLNNSITANNNGSTYVAWNWKRDPIVGMDIVSYTGNGVSNTVSHNLGIAPAMAIVKSRSGARGWYVYHKSVGTSASDSQYYYLLLNGTAARTYNASNWIGVYNTAISLGLYNDVVANGENYIAYLFSEVEGFSKFGSYTGNGLADGPFVWCGFRPKYILIKDATNINNWEILDTSRDTYNITGNYILANSSQAEATVGVIDILSNGFKNRFAGGIANTSGATVIFAAFAESPFKYARAR